MRSSLPKVLHKLAGKPLVYHAWKNASEATGVNPVLVIGHGADEVREAMESETLSFVYQEQQLGTGHAVQQAESRLRGQSELILVTSADMPLLTRETLMRLIRTQENHRGPFTMLTLIAEEPRGFGRVIRDKGNRVCAIVEEEDATTEQKAIRELNAGAYCFSANWLWEALKRIPLSPKGEYYLTDLVKIAVNDSLPVEAIIIEDPAEAIGINTRVHLAEAESLIRRRINQRWMLSGVTMVDPDATYIEAQVQVGRDTVIFPNTYLQGETKIGDDCVLGPDTVIRNSSLGNHCQVVASFVENITIDAGEHIGPFTHYSS